MSLRAKLPNGQTFQLDTEHTDPSDFIVSTIGGEPGDLWVDVKGGGMLNLATGVFVFDLGQPLIAGPVDQGVDWEDLAISVQMAVAARFAEMRKTGRDLTNIDDEEAEISSVVLAAVRDYFARD